MPDKTITSFFTFNNIANFIMRYSDHIFNNAYLYPTLLEHILHI